jgi:phospholipid/cholesterol/gamma-HCH transport system substrate-binding protein
MRFQIGIFVLGALILLAILIGLLAGSKVIRGRDYYTIVFDYAPGVATGTPVRRSGVRIGQVDKVEIDDATGKVRVTIVIDRPHVLYEDDQPILVHGALTGDTSIDIVPSSAAKTPAEPVPPHSDSSPPVIKPVALRVAQAPPEKRGAEPPPPRVPAKPGKEFTGTTQADVPAILKELSTATREMVPEIRRTTEEIQVTARNWSKVGERLDVLLQANQEKLVKTLDNLNDTFVRLGSVLSEENQRNLTATLKNVSAGSKNLESIAKNTDELLKESRQTVRRVNDSVTQADQVLANLQQATKPLAERSDSVMRNLDESVIKLNKTLTDVEELFRTGGQSDGTLRRILTDPSLYHNLNETICMFARLMPRLDRILRDAEVFADKIARHPESLGIGGVVNPSSGLKEAPSSTSYRPRMSGH